MLRPGWLFYLLLAGTLSDAQTTQGIITGRVFDRDSHAGIMQATITYTDLKTNVSGSARSNSRGTYAISFLPPGRYSIRAEKEGFKPETLPVLDLEVAGRVELNFPLRSRTAVQATGIYGAVPLAGQKEVVNFFGPDVGSAVPLEQLDPQPGTLQPALSYVIESNVIENLPLRGRDPYSLLLAVPAATSDTATARSLGLSIGGQRPSSSDFLLDGLENNDTLNTGLAIQVPPELVDTYRISTNSFSAESGKAAGFVANAVTRSGSDSFHGLAYAYLGNDIFNASSFQDNVNGFGRRPDRQLYAGFWAGGPITKRLWFSTGFESYHERGNSDPQNYLVPGGLALQLAAPNSDAASLLRRFPSPASDSNVLVGNVTLAPTITVDRLLLLERLDYRTARNQLMGRFAWSKTSQPDFSFSPYQGLDSGSTLAGSSVALEHVWTVGRGVVNDLRGGWSSNEQRLNRAHPEIPTLLSGDGAVLPSSGLLRGSRYHASTWELDDSIVWIRGRHILTVGGGYEYTGIASSNSFVQTGIFSFSNMSSFVLDSPEEVEFATLRSALPQLSPPDLDRSYGNNQFFGFLQDSFKLSNRIGVSAGVRYDSFGTLANTGVQDAALMLGVGSDIEERIAHAQIALDSRSGTAIYKPDRNDWSGRLGFSYDLRGNGLTLLRGGFGIQYDRPFGLLFQNIQFNDVDFRYANLAQHGVDYLQPFPVIAQLVGGAGPGGQPANTTSSANLTSFYWIDQGLRTPHVQTWFFGLEREIHRRLKLEISQVGALGRKLVASDYVNRPFSVSPDFLTNPGGYLNPSLPPYLVYRSNSGSSNYEALTSALNYQGQRLVAQVAYTYSHSIDNQSDPLLGEFTGLTAQSSTIPGVAAFTSQFDSRIDRASSDFDQRHNFVFYGVYRLPGPVRKRLITRPLEGWEIAGLGAFRSGFPFTVFAPGGFSALLNNRADLLSPRGYLSGTPIAGGKQYLNPESFGVLLPGVPDVVGNLGRNSIAGPGFYSVDTSLARSFPLKLLGESGRASIRCDLFNFLNHTNLANPDPSTGSLTVGSPTFGQAQYGRTTRPQSSLFVTPLDETARQVRFQLRLEF